MRETLLNLLGPTPLSRRKALWGIALVLPNTLGLLFFFGIPVLVAFYTSFQEWNALQPPLFVGVANFERLVRDDAFWNALKNTVVLAVMSVPPPPIDQPATAHPAGSAVTPNSSMT